MIFKVVQIIIITNGTLFESSLYMEFMICFFFVKLYKKEEKQKHIRNIVRNIFRYRQKTQENELYKWIYCR